MLLHPCISCQDGDHARCMVGQPASDGMIGGWECSCACRSGQPGVVPRLPTQTVTWREKIKDSAEAVDRAYAARQETFRAANAAGISMRKIAEAAGLSAAQVCKVIGGAKSSSRTSLDSEAVSS